MKKIDFRCIREVACRKVDVSGQLKPGACSARRAAQMEAALRPRPLPSPVPALASLGALLSHVPVARLGLRALSAGWAVSAM